MAEVEEAAAADRGELVPVTEQRESGTGLVGDGDQREGGVLVEHPRLVDHQQVALIQPGRRGAHDSHATPTPNGG